MKMKNRLEWSTVCLNAFQIMMAVHSHRKDKSGMTYFWHPLRVANSMKGWQIQTIALLHDIIEDGTDMEYNLLKLIGVSDEDIRIDGQMMSIYKLRKLGIDDEDVLSAVDSITKRENESYRDYLKRVKVNPLARLVKLADIDDNMSVERLSYLPIEKVQKMVEKYWIAMRYLRDIDPEPSIERICSEQESEK
jgi:(p)ppGpp synthase/HD superfamily hydrolase